MTYSLDEQAGQIQDIFDVDNLQAKNGFYICEEFKKKTEKKPPAMEITCAPYTKIPTNWPFIKKKVFQLALENHFY